MLRILKVLKKIYSKMRRGGKKDLHRLPIN
jgi:hypothetical protein